MKNESGAKGRERMGGAGRAEDTAAVGVWGFFDRMMRWLKPIKTALDPSLKKALFRLPSSVFRLPSSVFRLPSSVFRLPSSVFPKGAGRRRVCVAFV